MMNTLSRRTAAHAAVWVASLVLAGCFGGGSSSSSDASGPITPIVLKDPLLGVTDTGKATVPGLVFYQIELSKVGPAADVAEPFDVSAITLPVSDTTEPLDV